MKLKPFLLVSLVANFFIVLLKIIAAAITGSAAMASEGVHSIIDVVNQVLLIWGIKTINKSADFSRPLGYRKELYFWSSIVSVIIFLLGGCASIYAALVWHSRRYLEVNQNWSYCILFAALMFVVFSLVSAVKNLNKSEDGISIWEADLGTSPSTFTMLISTIGDLLGIIVAFLGLFLGKLYHNPNYDSAASLIIGIILFTLAFVLIRQYKKLLISEIISPTTLRKIVYLAQTDDAVVDIRNHFTMYLAPKEALLILETVFKDGLDTYQVNDSIERISKIITSRYPRIKKVYIDQAAA